MIKVGSRVESLGTGDFAEEGVIGTVVLIEDTEIEPYLIEWDKYVGGHDGLKAFNDEIVRVYKGKDGHCEWVNEFDIILIDNLYEQVENISNSLDGFCDCMITHNDMSGTCILMHDKKKFEELSESQEMSYRYYDTTDEEELLYKEASFVISGTKVMYLYKYKKEEVE